MLCLWFCHSGPGECVFTAARIIRTAVGGAGEFAGAHSFDTLHLSSAAGNLVLIRPGLEGAVFYGSGSLIVVEDLVAAVEGLRRRRPRSLRGLR